jgi:FkbM family methyltransferase
MSGSFGVRTDREGTMSQFSKARVEALIGILKPGRLTRIVDVGANPINDNPYKNLLDMGGCEVWGFEPQVPAFEELVRKKRENEHYLPYAIGDGTRQRLHICRSDGFTSLLPPNQATIEFLNRWHRAMHVEQIIEIDTRCLDDLAELPAPDLVKIDTQGAEAMVFENSTAKLSRATAVISEVAFVKLYEGQPLFHEQARILEGNGFLLSKFLFLKSKSLGSPLMPELNWRRHQNQLIDGDAVFVRSLNGLKDLDREQLAHLAICADAVFESCDLAVRCLSVLNDRGELDRKRVSDYLSLVPK